MKTIVLIGGGHGHLNFIKLMKKRPLNTFKVILISNTLDQHYSGMASGFIGGLYKKDEMIIHLEGLCKRNGLDFIKGKVKNIDQKANMIHLDSQDPLRYDVLSINIGASIRTDGLKLNDQCFPVKPLTNLENILEEIKQMKARSMKGPNVVVLGTGAAGVEIGLSTFERLKVLGMKGHMTFVGNHKHLLKGYPEKASSLIMAHTKNDSIRYMTHEKGIDIDEETLTLESGQALKYDLIIMATGSRGHDHTFMDDLPLDDSRFIQVDQYLKVKTTANIFAVGDCINFQAGFKTPKNGVLALDQSKVLYSNILNYLQNKDLEVYKPRKKFLSIVYLGNKRALLSYGKILIYGKWTWYLKSFIDQRYMKKFKI